MFNQKLSRFAAMAAALAACASIQARAAAPAAQAASAPQSAMAKAAVAAMGQDAPAAERAAVAKSLAIRGVREDQIKSVTRSPDERFDLVVARDAGLPNDVLYVSRDGRFAFAGDLIDLKNGANLTSLALQKINSVDFSSLPLDLALKKGNGKRKLVVFADPNCPYCKHLEIEQLSKLKDTTVYTFMIPILTEDSRAKSLSIDCSKDPNAAWEAWMTKNQAPTAAACAAGADRVNKSLGLANAMRVTATPTMFFEDGSRLAGSRDVGELEGRMAQASMTANAINKSAKK